MMNKRRLKAKKLKNPMARVFSRLLADIRRVMPGIFALILSRPTKARSLIVLRGQRVYFIILKFLKFICIKIAVIFGYFAVRIKATINFSVAKCLNLLTKKRQHFYYLGVSNFRCRPIVAKSEKIEGVNPVLSAPRLNDVVGRVARKSKSICFSLSLSKIKKVKMNIGSLLRKTMSANQREIRSLIKIYQQLQFIKNYLLVRLAERFLDFWRIARNSFKNSFEQTLETTKKAWLDFWSILKYYPILIFRDPRYSYRLFAKQKRVGIFVQKLSKNTSDNISYDLSAHTLFQNRVRLFSLKSVIFLVIISLLVNFIYVGFLDFNPWSKAATLQTKWDSQTAFETNVADLNSDHTPSGATTRVNVDTSNEPGQAKLAPVSFSDSFTNTTYKDAVNTTADWDTTNGQIALTSSSSWKYDEGGSWLGIDFISSTTGWAVGSGGSVLYTSDSGSTWSSQTSGITTNLKGVSALDSTHVWAVGDSGVIRFYNGSTWSAQTSVTGFDLYSVSALDSTHVWAVGYYGVILFYDGSTWSAQTSGITSLLYGVSALDSTHVWAVGASGVILFYDGSTWSAQTSGTTVDLRSVSALDSTHVWVMGKSGTILFYNGTSWSAQTSGTTDSFYGGSALDSTHVWAVADSGTIRFYNGSTWSSQTSGITTNLKGVSALDSTHVWAVGDGVIRFYNGSTWSAQTSGTGNTLNGVSALDSTHVWAVGESGAIRFYNGSTWAAQTSGITTILYSVSVLDSTHVWAVGESGVIRFYNGSTWAAQTSGIATHLNGVSALDSTHVWAVGDSGVIRFYDGSTWSAQTSNANDTFQSVSVLDFSHAWAGTRIGRIFKYVPIYSVSQTAQSLKINTGADNILTAKLTVAHTLNSQTITYYLSSDGGTNWESVTSGAVYNFTNQGNDLRWKAALSTADTLVTPSIQAVSIDYRLTGTITGFKINAGGSADDWGSITWQTSSLPSGTSVKFRTRSSPDNSTWTSWSSYYTASNSTITSALNQYLETEMTLTSDSASGIPSLDWFNITYIINAPPSFDATYGANGVQVSQNTSDGKVTISYRIKDGDTESGTITPDYITPSLFYDIGSGYQNITSSYLASGDLDNKHVDQDTFTTYTATWDAKAQINGAVLNNAKIKVTINDNEGANNTASAESASFALDVKNPVSVALIADGVNQSLNLTATDDSSLQMNISNTSGSFPEANYQTFSANPSYSITNDPQTVYVRVRDTYKNYTDISATTPMKPSNIIYQDITNPLTDDPRLFIAWGVVSEPNPGFQSYNILRSIDGAIYTEYTSSTARLTNYYVDGNVSSTITYYYKVYVKDSNNNTSLVSGIVSDMPNGTGGSDLAAPIITGVGASEKNASWAKITWTTDEVSNSIVQYAVNPAEVAGSDGKIVTTMTKSHSVTITGLTPNTKYYYQVRSYDPSGNFRTDNDNSNYYTVTTNPGPIISNITISQVNDTNAVVNWQTDKASNSYVTYSQNPDLSNSQVAGSPDPVSGSGNYYDHTVTLIGLERRTRYYFQVQSTAGSDQAIDNNGGIYHIFNTTYDLNAPAISLVSASPEPTTISVSWTTSELATSQVEYGLSESMGTTTTLNSTLTIQHFVKLENLSNNKLYYYRVRSKDAQDNESVSAVYSSTTVNYGTVCPTCAPCGGYSTLSYVDRTAPVISKVEISDVNSDKATFTWTTDEDASSLVWYGLTAYYNSLRGNGDSLTTRVIKHKVVLSDLISETKYYFKAVSSDSNGNVGFSQPLTFNTKKIGETVVAPTETTAPEIVPLTPEIIPSPTPAQPALEEQKKLEEQQKQEEAFIEVVKNFSQDLFSLASSVPSAVLEGGAQSVINTIDSLSNLIPGIVLSGVPDITVTSDTVLIKWKTNKESNSLVAYASEADFKAVAEEPYQQIVGNPEESVVSHQVLLINLQPSATYHFQLRSKPKFGSTVKSKDYTLTTKSELPKITEYSIKEITEKGATFIWRTNIPTDSTIKFTPYKNDRLMTQETKTEGKPEVTVLHEVDLVNLIGGLSYAVELQGYDLDGNLASLVLSVFSTSQDTYPPEISQIATITAISPKGDKSQVIISWTTDEPATSQIQYQIGLAENPEAVKLTSLDETLTKRHLVVLANLQPGQVYRFKVKSADTIGNESISKDYTLLTPQRQETIVQLIVKNFEQVFGWTKRANNK